MSHMIIIHLWIHKRKPCNLQTVERGIPWVYLEILCNNYCILWEKQLKQNDN